MPFDPITASAAVGSGPVFAMDTFVDTDAVSKLMPFGAIAFGPENGPYERVTDSSGLPVAQQGEWTVDLGATDNAVLDAIAASLDSLDDKTPALGQALAAASVPVVLTAAQVATLTPPAAITGFATAVNQATEIASLGSIDTATGRIAGKYVDFDTSGGTDSVVAVGILLPGSGGAVIGGTATNPVRTDPTGATTQPVSVASLPLPDGAASETTLAAIGTTLSEMDAGKLEETTFTGRLGEVQATPTANTVLGRLKDLLTGIVLAAGANVIGWVNLIAGQTGITGGAGTVAANTPRITHASDDPVATSLNVMDDWDETDRCKVNPIAGQAGVAAGAGAVGANTPRVTLASDDPAVLTLGNVESYLDTIYADFGANLSAIETAVELIDNAAATSGDSTVGHGLTYIGGADLNNNEIRPLPLTDDGEGVYTAPQSGQVWPVGGSAAHGAAVGAANPVQLAAQARTTNPTAVSDTQVARLTTDKVGRQLVTIGNARELIVDSGVITISNTTETDLLAAGGAGVFQDVTMVLVINTSATAVRVDFRDVAAGTVRFPVYAPAGATVGFIPPRPFKQATANNKWTAQLSASVTDVRIVLQVEKNV